MKAFFEFIRRESDEFRLPLILMAVFSGIVNGLTVTVAIRSIYLIEPGQVNTGQLIKLGACVAAFWISKEYVLNRSVTIIEKIVKKTRTRILGKIRNADLLKFEQMDSGLVFSALSTDAMTISMSAAASINAASSVVMLAFIILLIGISSMTALFITAGVISLAVIYYMRKSRNVAEQLYAATLKENTFYENLNGVLNGYKEFKLNRAKADDFFQNEIDGVIEEATELKIQAGRTLNHSILIGQTFLFFTIAGLLFLLPTLRPTDVSIIGILVPVIIFAAGPIGEIVAAVPAASKAQAAIYNIQQLEQMVDNSLSDSEESAESSELKTDPLQSLQYRGVTFQYPAVGSRPFCIQPFDLEIKQGETVFIVGGNGSGKSTLLKLLTGLYSPASGSVEWNGSLVDDESIASFRNLFTSIFTDFYLFKRILGMESIDDAKIKKLLKEFELEGKTEIIDGQISNTQLSTGQRKRLALIIATLEDKQVCIFDEWAADQDPVFRRYFYKEILPELKANGKTIIAVTHDDHYFDCADRVFEMDYGTLQPYSGKLALS